jgi:hypothetical protein
MSAGRSADMAPTAASAPASSVDRFARLPLTFEANHGQVDPQVSFLSRSDGYTVFLTASGAVMHSGGNAILRLRLMNAQRVEPKGLALRSTVSHYFKGSNPANWVTGAPHFGQVRYPAIYAGIDLLYRGNGKRVEYDFIVAPGANPGAIRFDVSGPDALDLGEQGDLVLRFGERQLVMAAPFAYQEIEGARRVVEARYVLEEPRIVSFRVADYDRSRPLVIDPVLYSSYLGGNGSEVGEAIAADELGNAYVTGETYSIDFPATLSGLEGDPADAFVTKLNADGTLAWSTYLGGTLDDVGNGIVVDGVGAVYITGQTESGDFPATSGVLQDSLLGISDAFVTKIDADGTLAWSTYLGGDRSWLTPPACINPSPQCSGTDAGYGIAVNSLGEAHVTGVTTSQFTAESAYTCESAGFPITGGAFQSAHAGTSCNDTEAFFAKLNATGSGLLYSTYLGGADWDDEGSAITLDSSGNAYIAGIAGANFPTTAGAVQDTYGGYVNDAFAVKFNPFIAGSGSLAYSTFIGGGSADSGRGIGVDASGSAVVVGGTSSNDFPTVNAIQSATSGNGDAFVAKLSSDGSVFVYSTYLGGGGPDDALAVAVDAAGLAYVTGRTSSVLFPGIPSPFSVSAAGGCGDAGQIDGYVTKVSPSGDALVFSNYFGGTSQDQGLGIAVDDAGNIYVAGRTQSDDFPTENGFQSVRAGGVDAFVARLSPMGCAEPMPTPVLGPAGAVLLGGLVLAIAFAGFNAQHRHKVP